MYGCLPQRVLSEGFERSFNCVRRNSTGLIRQNVNECKKYIGRNRGFHGESDRGLALSPYLFSPIMDELTKCV